PGVCTRTVSYGDDAGVPIELTCQAYSSSVSECRSRGRVAGYIAYKSGIDRSTGFCYVRDLRPGGF
ncbi:MAG: hypothetical protein JNG84_05715, partial [Archangium sp.]|nr:hypothetical protein [Archangium sp.]